MDYGANSPTNTTLETADAHASMEPDLSTDYIYRLNLTDSIGLFSEGTMQLTEENNPEQLSP